MTRHKTFIINNLLDDLEQSITQLILQVYSDIVCKRKIITFYIKLYCLK